MPTYVFEQEGKYFAVIRSVTNSTYTLIENSVEFVDVANEVYAASANELGSRMITNGVGNMKFEGDRPISRVEFAAMLAGYTYDPEAEEAIAKPITRAAAAQAVLDLLRSSRLVDDIGAAEQQNQI